MHHLHLSTCSSIICCRSCNTGNHSPPFSQALMASWHFIKSPGVQEALSQGALQKAMLFLATVCTSGWTCHNCGLTDHYSVKIQDLGKLPAFHAGKQEKCLSFFCLSVHASANTACQSNEILTLLTLRYWDCGLLPLCCFFACTHRSAIGDNIRCNFCHWQGCKDCKSLCPAPASHIKQDIAYESSTCPRNLFIFVFMTFQEYGMRSHDALHYLPTLRIQTDVMTCFVSRPFSQALMAEL